MKNPESLLAQVPQGEFNSRYADPTSRSSSGSVISFVTGGHFVPNPESRGLLGGIINVVGQAVRGEKQGSGWTKEMMTEQYKQDHRRGLWNRYSRHYGGRNGCPSSAVASVIPNTAKRVLKQDVLYLMVVNMPSDEEMAATRAIMKG